METAIYNLSVGGTQRGRVFMSISPNFLLVLDIVYPDDERMPINAGTPAELIRQFREVMRQKYGNERIALIPATPAEIEDYLARFRECREALLGRVFKISFISC